LSVYFSNSANFPANCLIPPNTTNFNALPTAGTLDPNFIPCKAAFSRISSMDGTRGPEETPHKQDSSVAPREARFDSDAILVHAGSAAAVCDASTQQWNLGIQHDLGKDWILEVGYVGTHSIHLRETRTNLPARLATPRIQSRLQT